MSPAQPEHLDADHYRLQFDTNPISGIDNLAHLACQDYNLGDHGSWFFCFRKGCSGFNVRLYAVARHYAELHEWQLRCRWHLEPEYHLASIFFAMESALECFLYAMNAYGYGIVPDTFIDITTEKGLRSIGPWVVLGSASRRPFEPFSRCFPRVSCEWLKSRQLIEEIQRQHDVSKHRSTTYVGGCSRNDPPAGFYEALGLPDGDRRRHNFSPMAEVILDPDPKRPAAAPRPSIRYEELRTLESLCDEFQQFVRAICLAWAQDAVEITKLRHQEFLQRYCAVGRSGFELYEDEECSLPLSGVQGLRLDWGHEGYPAKPGRVVPAPKEHRYLSGERLPVPSKHDLDVRFGPAWYRDAAGKAVMAWTSSALYVSIPIANPAGEDQ